MTQMFNGFLKTAIPIGKIFFYTWQILTAVGCINISFLLLWIGVPEWDLPATDPWNYKSVVEYNIGDFSNVCSDMQMRGVTKLKVKSFS